MAIRVTQQTMYGNMVGSMQKNLGNYMESVNQGSSQKRINRPSDDPAGTYRVLTTRVDMESTAQYQENVNTAKGWLNLADQVLSTNVTTAIQGLKTLAEQASTGTYNASQRKIMAEQARQYFGQLLNLSNTEFEGKSVFAGHKYDKNAFEEGLAVTTWDDNWASLVNSGGVKVQGASDSVVMVQFVNSDDAESQIEELKAGSAYRWSNNGGESWHDGVVEEDGDGNFLIKPADAGITVTIPKDATNPHDPDQPGDPLTITGAITSQAPGANNGTMLYIRPAAFYQGDDNDAPLDVTLMGAGSLTTENVSATGTFGANMLVRIDGQPGPGGQLEALDLSVGGTEFVWSYSTDGGANWTTAKGLTPQAADGKLRLPIPGGYVDFDTASEDRYIRAGAQVMVHPARADLSYEIMKDTWLPVNSVGKEVFGGYYEDRPALNGENNLFEVVGSFIGYLEGNCQEGCQRTLAALTVAEQQILNEATRIGGIETRLEMAADVLSFQKLDQQEQLSKVEDIDLTELLTKLTRQQLSYQTVLQSSSMIMQLSLAKYI